MEDDERPGGQGDECARDEEKSHSIGATGENTAPYSVFAPRQKTLIIILVAAAGFFSPFTAYVYFPALKTLANDFSVSIELMDLTVTAYLIVQGIAPCILADLSENIGRRPVYLLMFAIYCAASIGLSLQHDYTALLVLRMLQSVGCAPAIALAFGVIGDIAAPHERGVYVGASHIGFNSAPAIGPIIGGLITEKAGWSWIFVLLAAFSGSLLILLAFFLHETSRSIVGNGSIAATGVNQTFLQSLRSGGHNAAKIHKRLRIPSILPCLKLILYKNTSMLLVSYGTFYMMYSCLQATLAQLLEQYYKLSPLQAGLCYLPYGVAGGVASVRVPTLGALTIVQLKIRLTRTPQYTVGLLTDRDYRITAEQHNLDIDRRNGDDLQHFPIEKARLRSIFVYAYTDTRTHECVADVWQ